MTTRNDDKGDDMQTGLGVAERDLFRRLLHELPDTPPPRAVWERIAAQANAEGLTARRQHGDAGWLVAGGALAASVLVAALWPAGDAGRVDGSFPTEPPYVESANHSELEALRVRSELIERNLRLLPAEPRVLRAGTAAAIVELEDRIAAIDHALSDPDGTLTEAQTESYWRERVRLMDSLLQLRYAQATRYSM